MSKNRNARELVLKVLFQIDVGKLPAEEVLETAFEQVKPSTEERRYTREMVDGVLGEISRLDAIIDELAQGWRLERLARVDKNVLRAALYELTHRPDSPASTVINDAVEIAKKYSTEDSPRFVNGILGSYQRRLKEAGGETTSDPDEIEIGAH
ncbi:MAG: transcription antitermination factor NusB [Armatimonadota bacterium]